MWRNRQTPSPDGKGKLCDHYLQSTILAFSIFFSALLFAIFCPFFKSILKELFVVILTSCLFYTLQIYSPIFHLSFLISFTVLKMIWLKKFFLILRRSNTHVFDIVFPNSFAILLFLFRALIWHIVFKYGICLIYL